MRQLVIQFFQESATDQFRNGFFRTLFGDLLGRVHLRAFRHVLDKHVLDFRKIVMLQRADWHNIGEVGEFVDFNELVDQPSRLNSSILVTMATSGTFHLNVPSSRLTAKSERRRLKMRLSPGPIS